MRMQNEWPMLSEMKVALVHELLTTQGGAENVLEIFADMFPDAPIYTLLYDERKMGTRFPPERVWTFRSGPIVDLLPPSLKYNHHLWLRRFPVHIEACDFFDYDLVISSSSAFAHGIITNGKPKHLCYVHSPARYLWDRTHDVLKNYTTGPLSPLKKWWFGRTAHRLRTWDAEVAHRPDALVAASNEVQKRIMKYWRRESTVIHPPIADRWLTSSHAPRHMDKSDYLLVVSTLSRYKRIDLAIQASQHTGMHLKIVGEGPDKARLKSMAGENVEFCGYRHGNELGDLFSGAKAVLFPGLEDFGIVPLEAMACGTPVIAYRGGGALETVTEGVTGEFFDEPSAESLAQAIEKIEQNSYSKERCRDVASHFSKDAFIANVNREVEKLMS